MKANAPEKIHILPNAHDRCFEGYIPNGLPNGLFVEYTRTDVFIEKAVKFLKSYRQDTPDGLGYTVGIVNDKMIEDFKKYMEGE